MNRFILWMRFGQLEVSEDSGVTRGEAHIYTQQGNRHTIWAPQSIAEVERACDGVHALGEDPYGLAMHPDEHALLKSTVLAPDPNATPPMYDRGFKLVPRVCECGSAKAGVPFHSDWCPVK